MRYQTQPGFWPVIAGAALFIGTAVAAADVFQVTRTDDPAPDGCFVDDCSLREAIIAANETDGADEIELPEGVYVLSRLTVDGFFNRGDDAGLTGDLDIASDMTIRGAGMFDTIIDGNGIDRVLDIDPEQDGVTVEILDLMIRNGTANGDGNGIRNQGTATLARVSVNDNVGGSSSYGGGIYNDNDASLTLIDSVVRDNFTDGNGGGIASYSSTLTIVNSAIRANSNAEFSGPGGGIVSSAGRTTITGSLIADNFSAYEGGGIASISDDSLEIVDSQIIGNTSNDSGGGGVGSYSTERVRIRRSTIRDNEARSESGGGVFAERTANLQIGESTISGNTTDKNGGGIFVGQQSGIDMIESTISGNSAVENGGGMFITGPETVAALHFTTIVNNVADSDEDGEGDGGGIATAAEADVRISNTILAGNVDPTSEPDCFGEINNDGFNLIETVSAGCFLVGDPTGDIYGADPMLGPLADNGGPTRTHALRSGSPAIDAGGPECAPGDQRGRPREIDGNDDGEARCDIGAFERAAPLSTIVPGSSACGGTLGAVAPAFLMLGLLAIKLSVASRRRGFAIGTRSIRGLLSLLVIASFSGAALADEFVVTRFDDPTPNGCVEGDCSLREAVIAANDSDGEDEIFLSNGVYTLTRDGDNEDNSDRGDLDLLSTTSIFGAGIFDSIIEVNSLGRTLDVDPFQDGVTVNLFDLTIRNGNVAGDGGGIRNRGILNLTRVSVNDNLASDDGGGIRNEMGAVLTLVESVVVENRAGTNGGGIDNRGSRVTIVDSAVNDNEVLGDCCNGGGIDSEEGETLLRIANSTVNGNKTPRNGAGIYTSSMTTVIISDSEISGNVAGNGVFGSGGGIRAGGSGTISIARSTISDNDSDSNGGGIYMSADGLELENSTVSGNRSNRSGGGIYVAVSEAMVDIIHTTIADNVADNDDDGEGDGGGIYAGEDATMVMLANSILAGNTDPTSDPDCFGPIVVAGANLIELISDGCNLSGATQDVIAADAMLGPLADNGGPTRTHALLEGSPAVDAGDDAICSAEDQRSEVRAEDGDDDGTAVCDIGAFERAAPLASFVPGPSACGGTLGAAVPAVMVLGLLSLRLTAVPRRRLLAMRRCFYTSIVGMALSGPALAVEFTVSRTDDPMPDGCVPGDCSLREAIIAANATDGPDEIVLPAGVFELTRDGADEDAASTGDLDITDDVTILGAGIFDTIIDANRIDRVIDILAADSGPTVEFVDLAVRNGEVDGNGGGIRSLGMLTLTRVSVNDNYVTDFGGGVANLGGAMLTLIESVVIENETERGAAGIYNNGSTLTIMNSAVLDNEVHDSSGNDGGGIYTSGENASVTVENSVIARNHARFNGGGIHSSGSDFIVVTDSEISGNTAGSRGGGLRDFGTSVIRFIRCTIHENQAPTNQGGGLYMVAGEDSGGTISIVDTTVSKNVSGAAGGGVYVGPYKTADIVNSTVSGNRAAEEGGGVYVTGTGTVANISSSTIVNNTADSDADITEIGGGLNATNPDAVNLSRTIIANNSAGAGDPDCFGTINSQGFNLIETISAGCDLDGDPTGNVTGVDPLLDALADNGGATQTHALLDGSPAIDAGGNAGEAADQRGEARPEDGDGDGFKFCDIGAFEKTAPAVAPPDPSNNPCGASLGMMTPLALCLGLVSLRLVRRF